MLFKNGRYANVASTLALIVALGGTSYAAAAIAKNSVGSPQIINSSVKSKDVKNGTLKSADFKAGQLPAGAQGPAGPAGPVGAQGPIGPSTGYSFDSGSGFLGWTGAAQTVATLNVPAGSYVLSAKVMGNNNSAATATMDCELRANGGIIDEGTDILILAANLAGGDRQYMPMAGTVTAAGAIALTITCDASTNEGNWSSRTITAVKVGSIG